MDPNLDYIDHVVDSFLASNQRQQQRGDDRGLHSQQHHQSRAPAAPTASNVRPSPASATHHQSAASVEDPSFTSNARKLFAAVGSPSQHPTDGQQRRGGLEEYYGGGSPTSAADSGTGGGALRRMAMWAERKKARRAAQQEEKRAKETAECTFQPFVGLQPDLSDDITPSDLYKDNKVWGFESYVDRCLIAREQTEEKKKTEERLWGSPGTAFKPQQTIPEPFELGRLRSEIKSLAKAGDTLAPTVRNEFFYSPSAIEAPSTPSGIFSSHSSRVITHHSPPRRPL